MGSVLCSCCCFSHRPLGSIHASSFSCLWRPQLSIALPVLQVMNQHQKAAQVILDFMRVWTQVPLLAFLGCCLVCTNRRPISDGHPFLPNPPLSVSTGGGEIIQARISAIPILYEIFIRNVFSVLKDLCSCTLGIASAT